MPSVAQRMMRLFAGNETASGTHGEPTQDGLKWAIKSTAKTLRLPVTEELWQQHLDGLRPLGVIPIRLDNTCLWGSIDIDEYDDDLLGVIASVERQKLPLVPGVSKSGGLHLFMFLRDAQPAGVVLAVLREMAASLGRAGSEIFPKQTQVMVDRGDMGNWMVMPYYGDTYGGKIREQVGLKRTGAEMTIGEFIKLAEESRVDDKEFTKLASTRRAAARAPASPKVNGPFADGPPCLQHLLDQGGIKRGGQNSSLLMMGIYYRRADPANWESRLEQANQEYLSPPGTSEGLQSVINSLRKKDYLYTCKTEPMKSHCDSAVCRTRRFGVGEEGNYPVISSLSRLDTDPVIWFVDVDDERLEMNTETLLNYGRFHAQCVEQISRCYRLMKQDAWMQVISSVMDNLTVIEAPRDLSEAERFRELVEEFLTNRQRGQSREDILAGRPWEAEEESRYYFRLRDLQSFLNREGMREITRGKLGRRLEAAGGRHTSMSIKSKHVNVWWLPSGAFTEQPLITPPGVPGVPI